MLTSHSIHSELALDFAIGHRGQTILKTRKTGGLAHVGKPYWNGNVLLTQIVNPTAGFFAGDEIQSTITLAENTNVLLSQPGATRIHTMTEKKATAKIAQTITVAAGASLDLYPDLSISQRESSLEQTTSIHLTPDSRCCFLEILTPGRVAHGETLAWNRLKNTLNLYCGDQLLTRERMDLSAGSEWRLLNRGNEPLHLATFWLYHPKLSAWEAKLHSPLSNSNLEYGFTLLSPHFATIRILSTSSRELRNALNTIRALLHTCEPTFGNSTALF